MTLADRLDQGVDTSELTLELARRSHEPVATDKARNLAALRNRLRLPVPASNLPPSSPSPPQTLAATPPARSWVLAPWQQLLAVGAVTGAIGFFLGLGVSERASPTFALAPSSSAVLGSAPVAHAEQLQPALAPSPAVAAAEPSAQLASGQPAAVAAPKASVPARVKPRRASPRPALLRGAAAPSDVDFLEAVKLLSRARRALDRHEPALALGLLDELDARFSAQVLDEERAATRVLGLCASGDSEAALVLARREFSGRPRSIYTRRLEQSCASEALRK